MPYLNIENKVIIHKIKQTTPKMMPSNEVTNPAFWAPELSLLLEASIIPIIEQTKPGIDNHPKMKNEITSTDNPTIPNTIEALDNPLAGAFLAFLIILFWIFVPHWEQ